MEIKISEDLNAIISYARQEAMRTGNYTIRPDHLYLGILRHRDNEACDALVQFDVDIDDLKRSIDESIFTSETIPYTDSEHVSFSRTAQNVLSFTILEASRASSRTACPRHLLLALAMDSTSAGTGYLRDVDVDYPRITSYFRRSTLFADGMSGRRNPSDDSDTVGEDGLSESRRERDGDAGEGTDRQDGRTGSPDGERGREPGGERRAQTVRKSLLEEFGFDMTRAAAQGLLDPTVGREDEMERVLQILGRRRKNNPMLVGDPGVGKTAIVEGIATRIAAGKVPPDLIGKRIISLDIASVVAGTKYRGEFEKRIKAIIKEITETPDTILFMDEFHTIVGAGSAEGSLDAANIMKPALARGEIHCIGATTFDEFAKIVEKDKSLDRRFQKVTVQPTGIDQTVFILESIRENYEKHHGVKYTVQAIEDCVKMSERYITDRCLPDKAIDILDEAGSMVHLRSASGAASGPAAKDGTASSARSQKDDSLRAGDPPIVTTDDIAAVVSKMTGIPTGHVLRSEGSRLLNMPSALKARIIGQDDAVDTLVRAIRRNRAGIRNPSHPIGVFMFVGPTGVGKTLLAKALAEYLFDSEDNLIRVDMSEYMEKFNVSRLIGAPPGYVGYNEGGQLSEKVRRRPYSVVLMDEIEKAHPDVFNILLQIMDEGRLTDSNGRLVDFRNTVIIMTSNAGSRESAEYGKGLGFTTAVTNVDAAKKAIVEKSLRRTFPPEFLGRIDEPIFFNPLGHEELCRILDIEIKELSDRLADFGLKLQVTEAAKRMTVNSDYNPKFGARPLKRAIRKYIEDPVSEYILSHDLLSAKLAEPLTIKVGVSHDRQGTCVYLSELYVDDFQAHLADHVNECAQ